MRWWSSTLGIAAVVFALASGATGVAASGFAASDPATSTVPALGDPPSGPGSLGITGGHDWIEISFPEATSELPVTYEATLQPGDHRIVTTTAGTLRFENLPPDTHHVATVVASNAAGTGEPLSIAFRTARAPGYWMIDRTGRIFSFGAARDFGPVELPAGVTVVDMDAPRTGSGLWVLDSVGTVHALGDAPELGGLAPDLVGSPTALVTARSGGYWVVTDAGDVSAHGAAPDRGDLVGLPLNAPIVDVAPVLPYTDSGYWMVASDGGVFAFGDAWFHGSMGGRPLNAPVVGIRSDPDGRGYWLAAADGGVFAFDADFRGSMGGVPLNAPVIELIAYGRRGYAMVAADGGAFVYSDEDPFLGSLGGTTVDEPIVAMAAVDTQR